MRLITRLFAPLTIPVAMLLPAGGAFAAPAETVKVENFFFQTNTCNGEVVLGEATVHSVFKVTQDGAFQNLHIHGQGVGTQGNEYVFNFKQHIRQEPGDLKFEQRALLVSKGSEPNQVVIISFDPDSGVTIEADCRG